MGGGNYIQMDTEISTQNHPALFDIIRDVETATHCKFCLRCSSLLPEDSFKAKTQRFRCYKCFRNMRREFLSSQLQRAYNTLLCRARKDTRVFAQDRIELSTQDLRELPLTKEQIKNCSVWSIVPRSPGLPLTKDNAILIPSHRRRFLVHQWKTSRDHELYARDLQSLTTGVKNNSEDPLI